MRSRIVCFRASWSSIDGTVVAAHIHPAPVGVPGPVAIPLFEGTFAGTDSTSGCVSANGLAAANIANPSGYYVNIHSTVFPPGAVRAQLADERGRAGRFAAARPHVRHAPRIGRRSGIIGG